MKNLLKKCLFFLSLVMPVAPAIAQTIAFENDFPAVRKSLLPEVFEKFDTIEKATVFIGNEQVTTGATKMVPVQDGVLKVKIVVNANAANEAKDSDKITLLKRNVFGYDLYYGNVIKKLAQTGLFTFNIHFDCKVYENEESLRLYNVIDEIRSLQLDKKLKINWSILRLPRINVHLSEKTQ